LPKPKAMKPNAKIIVFPLLAAAVALTVFAVKRIEGPTEYINSILEKRRRIDLFMEQSPDSPFPVEQRSTFQGLKFFPPDPAYRVTARLVPIAAQEEVLLPTSDGTVRRYLRYAWAEFDLQAKRHRLLLLKERDSRVSNKLFLAFRDRTSGRETYGGGRYIDLFQQRYSGYHHRLQPGLQPLLRVQLYLQLPPPPREKPPRCGGPGGREDVQVHRSRKRVGMTLSTIGQRWTMRPVDSTLAN